MCMFQIPIKLGFSPNKLKLYVMGKKKTKPNLKTVRTCVYNCNYHIVFSTKYRIKVLAQDVEEYLVKMIKGITAKKVFLKFPHIKRYLWKGHLRNPSVQYLRRQFANT